jgi:excisionase family DNA binding protein
MIFVQHKSKLPFLETRGRIHHMFLSVKSTAARYGVNPRTIYTAIEEGRLPAIRIGEPGTKRPVIRIPLSALEQWEAKQLGQGGAK